MKPEKLKAIVDNLDVDLLTKSHSYYRFMGVLAIIFSFLSTAITVSVVWLIVVIIVLPQLALPASSSIGLAFVFGGLFLLMFNGLSNNFRYEAFIQFKKAELVRNKKEIGV